MRHLLDSEAARKAIKKGLSLALRYMRKAFRISLASLHDMSEGIDLDRVESSKNKSDILTKSMDQRTLTRHLFSLGFYALEWSRENKDGMPNMNKIQCHDGNSGTLAVAIQHAAGEAIRNGLLKMSGRSV